MKMGTFSLYMPQTHKMAMLLPTQSKGHRKDQHLGSFLYKNNKDTHKVEMKYSLFIEFSQPLNFIICTKYMEFYINFSARNRAAILRCALKYSDLTSNSSCLHC